LHRLPLLANFGDNASLNPSLDIAGIPKGSDAPGRKFIHWVAWNIAVGYHIKEARPMEAEGLNDISFPQDTI